MAHSTTIIFPYVFTIINQHFMCNCVCVSTNLYPFRYLNWTVYCVVNLKKGSDYWGMQEQEIKSIKNKKYFFTDWWAAGNNRIRNCMPNGTWLISDPKVSEIASKMETEELIKLVDGIYKVSSNFTLFIWAQTL